jgi:hypothetical protein
MQVLVWFVRPSQLSVSRGPYLNKVDKSRPRVHYTCLLLGHATPPKGLTIMDLHSVRADTWRFTYL